MLGILHGVQPGVGGTFCRAPPSGPHPPLAGIRRRPVKPLAGRPPVPGHASPARVTGQLDTSPIDNDDFHIAVHADFLSSHPDSGNLPSSDTGGVWCTAGLPDDVWWHSAAIHESAHATLAWMLGLSVQYLALAKDRTQLEGGGAWVDGSADAQYYTVETLGPAIVQADWLANRGYIHPELRRCVEKVSGSGDQATVDGFTDQGFVVDRTQAVKDARKLLTHPRAQAALQALAELLLEKQNLDDRQIAQVFDSHRLEPHSHTHVWQPGRRLPLIAAPTLPVSTQRAEPPQHAMQAHQEKPEVSLERLRALAKRIDSESQLRQRAAQTPQESGGAHRTSSAQTHTEHLLNRTQQQQGKQPR